MALKGTLLYVTIGLWYFTQNITGNYTAETANGQPI